MQNIYNDFLEILEQYKPDVKEAFGKPIDEKILNGLNEKFEGKLPEEFLDFYKKADGEKNCVASILGFTLMPIEMIKREYEFLTTSAIAVKPYHKGKIREGKYNSMWLPIASDGGGSFFAMDLAPDVDGIFGQIITLDIESNISYVIAPSFKELLLEVIPTELKNGNFDIDDDDPEMFTWVDGHYFNNIKKRNVKNMSCNKVGARGFDIV